MWRLRGRQTLKLLAHPDDQGIVLRRDGDGMSDDRNHRLAGRQILEDDLLHIVLAVEVLRAGRHVAMAFLLVGHHDEVEVTLQAFAGRIGPDQRDLQATVSGRYRDRAVFAVTCVELFLLVEK
jgi:hypothetical protein